MRTALFIFLSLLFLFFPSFVSAEVDETSRLRMTSDLEVLSNDWIAYLRTLSEHERMTQEVLRTLEEEVSTLDNLHYIPQRRFSAAGPKTEPVRRRLFCMNQYLRCENHQCLAPYAASLDAKTCDNTCAEQLTGCLETVIADVNPVSKQADPLPNKVSTPVFSSISSSRR